jgi:hypothetical protein
MSFLFGVGLGALATIEVAFIFAADKNIVDENDDEWYT